MENQTTGQDYPQVQPLLAVGQPYEVKIRRVNNGFIVDVGCKTLVANTWDEIAEGLSLYWKDQSLARTKYCTDEKVNVDKLNKLKKRLARFHGGNKK